MAIVLRKRTMAEKNSRKTHRKTFNINMKHLLSKRDKYILIVMHCQKCAAKNGSNINMQTNKYSTILWHSFLNEAIPFLKVQKQKQTAKQISL